MADDDLVYLLRRATEERTKVAETTDKIARAAHRGMAEAYDGTLDDAGIAAPVGRPKLRLRSI